MESPGFLFFYRAAFIWPSGNREDIYGLASAGSAEITERNSVLTDSEDLNTAATSGSRTTAIMPVHIWGAKRLGFAFA